VAAKFKPRGPEYAMQLFELTSVRFFYPGPTKSPPPSTKAGPTKSSNQPPLLRLRDRYIVDTTDLRLYENTGYARYSQTPGAVTLSPARLANGMERIRKVARELANPVGKPNEQLIKNRILLAISEIHPGVKLTDEHQQSLMQAIGKRETATIA
ncbi:uncharacterized protein METZ01_LOCUS367978, partial [marine metagenome]